MSEEMRTGFAGVVERLKAEGQSSVASLNTLRESLVGELSGLGAGIANVSNSIFQAALITPPPAPQSAADEEDAQDQRNIFTRMLGTLDAIQRGVTGGRDAVRDERGFGKLLALFGAGMGGLLTALGPFVKLLKGGLILGAVYFALDAFEEMLDFFEDPSWEGLGNILTSIGISLGLIIAAFPMKTLALIKALPRSFRLLRVFFMRTLPNFFRNIMPTIARKLTSVLRVLSTSFAMMRTFFVTTLPSFFARIKGSMLVTKILSGISIAFTALKAFFLTTLLPMLSGFLATLTPIIVAAAPFIAIGAAIAFAFFAVYKGIQAFIDKFKETGSIMDGLIAMGTTILTLPFTLIKDLISYIADLLGFENFSSMLDSIDFAASAFEFISGLVNDIVGFFTGLFDIDFGALIRKIPGAGFVMDFLGIGGKQEKLEKEFEFYADEEEKTRKAGALGRDRETGQIRRVTRLQTGMSKKRSSEMMVREMGLELVSPEERERIETAALNRAIAANQALEDFEAMPKLGDFINPVKEKIGGIYSGIRDSVVSGFNTVVDAVTDFIVGIGDAVLDFFGFGSMEATLLMRGVYDPELWFKYNVIEPITDFIDKIGNEIFKFFGFGEFDFTIFMMDPKTFLNYHVIMPIEDLFHSIGNSISNFFSNMVESAENFIHDIGNSILKFFGFGEFAFDSLIFDPATFFNYYIVLPITDLFNSIGNSITDFFNNMVDTVTNFILDIGQSILEFFFPDTSMVFSELSPMDFVRNFIIDPIKNFFTDIGLKFFDFFGIDALPLFISDVSPIEFFKGFILDPIKNFFVNALTTVGEFFQSIMDFDFLQFIKDNVPGAGTALKIIGGIGSAVSSLFGGSGDDPVTEDDRRQALVMTGNPYADLIEERRITAARMQVKDMTDRLANAAMTNNSGDDAKSVNTTVNAPVNNISNSSPTTVTSTPIVPGNMSLQAMRQASSA